MLDSKIVADEDGNIDITQVPWMVSLGLNDESEFVHQCGGSLITAQHVLTAAYCFADIMDSLPPK